MKKLFIVFFSLLTVLLFTMIFAIAGFNTSSVYFEKSKIYHMPSTQIIFEHGFFNIVYFKNDQILDKTLIFSTTNMQVDVDVNNQSIYSCGYEDDTPNFIKSTGTVYHIVKLPEDYNDSAVRIKTVPLSEKNPSNFHLSIYGGSYSACLVQLFLWALPMMLSAIILLFCAVILLIAYFKYLRKMPNMNKSGLAALILLAVFLSVWLLNLEYGLQFFIGNPYIIYFISAFSFLLLPIPFCIFLHSLCQSKMKKGLLLFIWIFMANALLNWIIQIFTPWDMFYLKPFTYVLMFLNYLYAVFICLYERIKQKNRIMKKFAAPLILLGLIVAFYILMLTNGDPDIIPYPLTYILLLSFLIYAHTFIQNYRVTNTRIETARYYEELAQEDILCGVKSRNAYKEMLPQLEKDGKNPRYHVAVSFDIDNLKKINESSGETAGDLALCTCCHCIKKVFPLNGVCYRTDGDDFVYMIEDLIGTGIIIEQFLSLVEKLSQDSGISFCVDCGYAFFDDERDSSFQDTIRRSKEDLLQNRKRKEE